MTQEDDDIREARRVAREIVNALPGRIIPVTNEISMYFHCNKCLEERPPDVSPMEWSRTQAGFTPLGIQIWCNRHECNVAHIDFEGIQHPANTDIAGPVT